MQSTQEKPSQLVTRLLAVGLREPRSAAELPGGELDLLLQLFRRVRLHGRLAFELEREGLLESLPRTARQQLKSALVFAEGRVRVTRWELDRLAWATRDIPEVDLILMKGCAYSLLELPNAPGRMFADVDLLLAEDQLEHVETLLNRRGWKTRELAPHDDNYYRIWSHELPPITHRDREVEIDLHHSILPRTARLKPAGALLVGNSRPVPGSRFRALAEEDLVLHAMVHLMVDSDMADRLRDLVDIDELCRHFSALDDEFWVKLVTRSEELGLGRPLYYSLRYVERLLGGAIPADVIRKTRRWAPPAPVRSLMDTLVPRALFPAHPEYPSRGQAFARLLLYMRSHWLRMPPWLLAYHLGYKFVVARFRRSPEPEETPVG